MDLKDPPWMVRGFGRRRIGLRQLGFRSSCQENSSRDFIDCSKEKSITSVLALPEMGANQRMISSEVDGSSPVVFLDAHRDVHHLRQWNARQP